MTVTSTIPLSYWLILSSALFSLGIYGFLTRRNAIGILISIEILVNSTVLNFILFDRYGLVPKIEGEVMGLLVIALAACEVVILFAILLALFRHKMSVNVTKLTDLKG
ncbi:MAG: NADH-quinone oxidoreductase subunit NuoK [Halobacteriovoraceae bacterium]|jgi:NADH-quinone oxidoreductase subunit K|nr:NADH-quinone oxidoreductase subunit NuoK [Halobacteriovoraceae bacterium]